MTKKVVTSTAPSKAKKTDPKVVPKVKDSTEIDDLFSALSSAKKAKTEPAEEKHTVKKSEKTQQKERSKDAKDKDEVTLSDLEDLDEEEDDDFFDNEESENLIKGTAYDPKKDDIFPASSGPTASIADSDFFDSRGLKRKTRALTEDGYPIYTPSELKIGMGGGTDLCPFDCNCCY